MDLCTEFIDAALDNRPRAEEMLREHPEIRQAGLHAALVLGDASGVDASRANEKGGPRDWEPLLYVCFSRFAVVEERAQDFANAAAALLKIGANPNASYIDPHWPDWPLPCLYGATGLNNNPQLATVLIEGGAKLDDNESLYHSTEHADLECVRLLLKRGANPNSVNVLKHVLDWESGEGVRLLLEAGADPNAVSHHGSTALHWAVWRGRSAAIVEQLLDGGASIDAKREDGRTAYAMALIGGKKETAALLERRGADRELPRIDQLLAAGDAEQLRKELCEEYFELLPQSTASRSVEAVKLLLAAGVPVNTRGESGGTALHWACWKGYPELVEMLIGQGASLTIKDTSFDATPAGWWDHGRRNCQEGLGDYAAVERILKAKGAM